MNWRRPAHTKRGRTRLLFVVSAALGAALAALSARRWLDAVEVRGGSMLPSLRPGDRLLVERWTYRRRTPRIGELVLAPDPREPRRELIKRVAAMDGDVLELRGDAAAASTDSRAFGAVPVRAIRWRVVGRYWPVSFLRRDRRR